MATLTDGSKGRLVARAPLVWSLRLGALVPDDWRCAGEVNGNGPCTAADVRTAMVRTDLYLQAQGILRPDRADTLGDYCYRITIELGAGTPAASST